MYSPLAWCSPIFSVTWLSCSSISLAFLLFWRVLMSELNERYKFYFTFYLGLLAEINQWERVVDNRAIGLLIMQMKKILNLIVGAKMQLPNQQEKYILMTYRSGIEKVLPTTYY